METAGPKLGQIGENVARNVKRFRGRIGVRELSRRLTEIGRPILPSGITKIEQGARRVDADDLVALALALEVNPNALLMPETADGTATQLTEDVTATARQSWAWAAGDNGLARWQRDGSLGAAFRNDRGTHDLSAMTRWFEVTKPHKTGEELGEEAAAVFKLAIRRERASKKGGRDDEQR